MRAGGTATFTATVANTGPSAAQNLTIDHTLTSGYTAVAIGCTAAGGATCPAATGASMNLPQLPPGGSLTLSIPVPVAAKARGAITSALQVTSAGDPVSANNGASATTIAEDPRNDTYRVYATHGLQYLLTVDFDARTYTMTGNGLNATGVFTAHGGPVYTFADNAKFVVTEDALIGHFDFGGGVKLFIAARKFVTTMTELSGAFNNFGLNFDTAGAGDSRIYTSRLRYEGGNPQSRALDVCTDNIIYKIEMCPADSLWSYTLSMDGDLITGVDAVHGDTHRFRVAKSGGALIYLAAGDKADGSGRRFRIGMPEASGLYGGYFTSFSTAGAWGSVTLTATTYKVLAGFADGSSLGDSATLSSMGADGPGGIRGGSRASDGAFVFVMQTGNLAAVVGARAGPAAGYMELSGPVGLQ